MIAIWHPQLRDEKTEALKSYNFVKLSKFISGTPGMGVWKVLTQSPDS